MQDSVVDLSNETLTWDGRVKDARKQNDPVATLTIAQAGADAITKRIAGTPKSEWTEEEKSALTSVKRFTYNAAADAWPGWSLDGPRLDAATLTSAKALAQTSTNLVVELQLGAIQEGTGLWLVGAFDLALGNLDEALSLFTRASALYAAVPAPGLALLTNGYAVIVTGMLRKLPREDISRDLESVCAEILSGPFHDGQEWVEQLRTALAVFT